MTADDLAEHREVAGWVGAPGACGVECACGVTYDGCDTITEASALLAKHIANHRPVEFDQVIAVTPEEQQRAEYIKGLRMFADLLEQNPDTIPLPYDGGIRDVAGTRVSIWFHESGGEVKEKLAAAARVFPGRLNKEVRHGEYFNLTGSLAGFYLEFCAMRSNVCERVVIAEREVTETIPDPSVDVPLIEVTRTVQDVEWKCPPSLLAEDGAR